jgi:malonyl-CoA O-methyltransferase
MSHTLPTQPSACSRPDPAAVARALSRLAQARVAPWLHGEIARRMTARLAAIRRQPRTVIDWWSFTGGAQQLLAAAYPTARRLLVEPTSALRARSEAGLARPWWSLRKGARATVIDVSEARGSEADLLFANMTLHSEADPLATFVRWHDALAVDGFLMFSTFGPDTARELRALYRASGWGEPACDYLDMHDLGDMLLQAGFADPVMDMEQLTLTWAGPRELLSELRELGGNFHCKRVAGLRTPRWHARLLESLATHVRRNGRLAVTFEIVYGHAFKPAPRVPAARQTAIGAETLRSMARSGRRPTEGSARFVAA